MKVISTVVSASVLIGSVIAILGGQKVPQGTKTYVTGIRSSIDPKSADDFSFCGGALISPTHVLTTASCTTTAAANFVSVGAHYINGGEDGDEIKVVDIKNHPHFNKDTLANDFAVLTLAKPSKYKPVKLPALGGADIKTGIWATVMGWGLTSAPPNGMGSEELLSLSQQVWANQKCREALKSDTIDMSQVCAGGVQGQSPCQGDTGGPLIKENAKGDGDDVLIGLVSGGNGCGQKGSPAIYSRVSSALPWISSVTKNFERLPKLQEYQDKGVFTDSINTLAQCWQFVQLQLPKQTSVDLLEFVEGAQVATEAHLRAMNGVEFAEFLAEKENSSSQVADSLQQYMTPVCYHQMALQVKKDYLHRNFYVECEKMKVEKAQLARVVYRRLTEKEYADFVACTKLPKVISPDATVEHLSLHMDVATVEDLNIVFLQGKTRHVQQQNLYRVVFESRVTEPEQVDWRIESMYIIGQKAMERPDESVADASDDKQN
ncbi:Glucanase inhibitor protein 2 [Phytophthora ramorum]|nr:Glucanase inhibitor protein 2 [Phytophthora ramorum]